MSNIINISVNCNTTAIIKKYSKPNISPDNPAWINYKHVYFTTTQGNRVSGQPGGELAIKAQVGDIIHLQETSLPCGFENTVIFYRITPSLDVHLIEKPYLKKAIHCRLIPNPTEPARPRCEKIENYFWESTILKTGYSTYHFNFLIVDKNCKLLGYFYCNPFISIDDNNTYTHNWQNYY